MRACPGQLPSLSSRWPLCQSPLWITEPILLSVLAWPGLPDGNLRGQSVSLWTGRLTPFLVCSSGATCSLVLALWLSTGYWDSGLQAGGFRTRHLLFHSCGGTTRSLKSMRRLAVCAETLQKILSPFCRFCGCQPSRVYCHSRIPPVSTSVAFLCVQCDHTHSLL